MTTKATDKRKTNPKFDRKKAAKVRRIIRKHVTDPDAPFGVTFIKRTTGERRVMTCRLRGDTNDKERSYDPAKYGLLPVYDVINNGWRSIPLDGVITISINGNLYTV
jgi:hypothetical protein